MSEQAAHPVIVDEHGDIELYPTIQAACFDLEAIDVRNDEYEVFDSRGNRLAIAAEGERVRIWLDPRSQPAPEELADRLRRFISRVGPDRIGIDDAEAATLDQLVRALARFFAG
jgi:hypothetical protein